MKNSFVSLSSAFIVFGLASLTDFLDGYIARKNNLISDLGRLLDPIADKILVIGIFCAFLELRIISVWMVSLIMLREFIITGLRLYGLNKGVVLEAKKFGKHKTVSQVVGILAIFIIIIINKKFPESFVVSFLYYKFIPILMWYIVSITLFSGIYYFWINRRLIRTL